jgi:hypothetical protein
LVEIPPILESYIIIYNTVYYIQYTIYKILQYTILCRYTLDDAGRVYLHTEAWDISALDAFLSTVLPGFGAPPAPPAEALRAAARAGGRAP